MHMHYDLVARCPHDMAYLGQGITARCPKGLHMSRMYT